MLVKQVMDKTPPFCVQFDTAKNAAMIMKRNGVTFVPVVENEPTHMYIGAVSDRDLAIRVLAEGRGPDTTVSDIAANRDAFCRPDDPVEKALRTMARKRMNNLAVLDDERQVVGIVSLDDIVECAMPDGAKVASAPSGGRGQKPQGSAGSAVGKRGGTARARRVSMEKPIGKRNRGR
jgi:CBS domain-containing protein